MPVTVLYLGNFKLIQNLKASVEKRLKGAEFQPISAKPAREEGAETDEESQKKEEAAEARLNEPLSMAAVKNVLNIVGTPILNLSLVVCILSRCISSNMLAPPVLPREQTPKLLRSVIFGIGMRSFCSVSATSSEYSSVDPASTSSSSRRSGY